MSQTKPKLALCLSGRPVFWRDCIANLRATFAAFDCDVYIHTWDGLPQTELEAVLDAYQPKAYAVTRRPDFDLQKIAYAAQFPITPQISIYDMIHSIFESLKLALQSGEAYDYYARVRFDLVYGQLITPAQLSAHHLNVLPWRAGYGVNDLLYISQKALIADLCGMPAWLSKLPIDMPADSPEIVCEGLFKRYLELHAIPLHTFEVPIVLRRMPVIGRRAWHHYRDSRLNEMRKLRALRDEYMAICARHGAEPATDLYHSDLEIQGWDARIIDLIAQYRVNEIAVCTGDWKYRLIFAESVIRIFLESGNLKPGQTGDIRTIVMLLLMRMDTDNPQPDAYAAVLLLLSPFDPDRAYLTAILPSQVQWIGMVLGHPEIPSLAPHLTNAFMGIVVAAQAA